MNDTPGAIQTALDRFCRVNQTVWATFGPAAKPGDKAILVDLLDPHVGYLMGNCLIAKYLQKRERCRLIGVTPSLGDAPVAFIRQLAASYGIDAFYAMDHDFGFSFKVDFSMIDPRDLPAARRALVAMTYDGVQVGDLAYDWYLRNTRKGTVDVIDKHLLMHVAQVIRDLIFFDTLIKKEHVVATVQGHMVYQIGAMARAALKNNAVVYGKKPAGCTATVRRYRALEEAHAFELKLTEDEFDTLLDTHGDRIVAAGKTIMARCFEASNVVLGDRKRAYSKADLEKTVGIDPNRPTVCIMSHVLPDAPHSHESMLYADYYEWLEETLEIAASVDRVNWLVKEHPHIGQYNPVHTGTGIAAPFVRQVPHIFMAPGDINILSLSKTVDAIVTCSGTAGLEFSTQGVPCVLAGDSHYSRFGFTIEPGTKAAYADMLRRIDGIAPLDAAQVRRARAYAFGFHRLLWVRSDLLPDIPHSFAAAIDVAGALAEATERLLQYPVTSDKMFQSFNRQLDDDAPHMLNPDMIQFLETLERDASHP